MSEHNPDCDVNDINPDGIKKPCNCGVRADKLDALCREILAAVASDDAVCSEITGSTLMAWEKRRKEA